MLQKSSLYCLWILAAVLFSSPSAKIFAQAGSGTIDGIVFDASGSLVPGAQVTLTREGTGDVRRAPTNDDGFFSFGGLPAASYTLEVEFEGFSKFHEQGITIHFGDKITLRNIALKPGALSEVVNVTDGMENLIPVDNGEKASVITSSQVENISIIGRSAVELLKIIPGAVNQWGDTGYVASFQGGVGSYNVAGSRNEALGIVSDGANVGLPSCNCGVAVTPNVEMISEFKVVTANSGAENSTGPVVINSVTKSGTKDFHGAGYLYARNYRFNSKGWQANHYDFDKPHDSFYFPGFNIGGPVLVPGTEFNKNRDKLFFFAGVEWTRQNVDQGVHTRSVPTAKMRQGDFSEIIDGLKLATPDTWNLPKLDGNSTTIIDPSLFDKGGQVLMGLLPLPNLDPAKNNGFNYVSNFIAPQNRFQGLIRLDYIISNNTKLYTRLNYEVESTFYSYGISNSLTFQQYSAGPGSDVPYPTRGVSSYSSVSTSTGLVQVLNPSTTNEIVFASTWIDFPRRYEDPSKISRQALGYPYQGIFKSGVDRVPDIHGYTLGIPPIASAGGLDPVLSVRNWIPSLADNFMKVKGTHTLKLGVFFQLTTSDGDAFPRVDQGEMAFADYYPNSTRNVYADLLLGRPGYYGESTQNVDGKLRQRELTFYLQDNWKATRRLTFELGARFEHMGQWYDPRGLTAGFDPNKYDPAAPIDAYTGIVAKYKGDDVAASIFGTPALLISPRFGFAYDVTGKGNTVLRGGFGSFVYRDSALYAYYMMGNPPLQCSTSIDSFFFGPHLSLAEIERFNPAVLKPKIDVFDPTDNRLPIQYSWNFTLSHRLHGGTILEASYLGNSSHNQMVGNYNINSVPEGAMFGFPKGGDFNNYRPYQNYGIIQFHDHILTQNYNSLQLTFNRQARVIGFTGSYVFSKALGTSGFVHGPLADSFDFRGRSYGVLPYDRTQAFKIAYNIQLPSRVRIRGLREVLNGWQFSGITVVESGAPFRYWNIFGTMGNGEPFYSVYVAGTPDTWANPQLTCDPRQGLGNNQYANANCFASPLPEHNGPYQFPYLKQPFTQNHDLSLFKNFALSSKNESRRLQLRFSGYNFVNHPQPILAYPDITLNFDNGVLSKDSSEKFGRSSEKIGRRVIQFAVKFMF